jgi:hypothetical protein
MCKCDKCHVAWSWPRRRPATALQQRHLVARVEEVEDGVALVQHLEALHLVHEPCVGSTSGGGAGARASTALEEEVGELLHRVRLARARLPVEEHRQASSGALRALSAGPRQAFAWRRRAGGKSLPWRRSDRAWSAEHGELVEFGAEKAREVGAARHDLPRKEKKNEQANANAKMITRHDYVMLPHTRMITRRRMAPLAST